MAEALFAASYQHPTTFPLRKRTSRNTQSRPGVCRSINCTLVAGSQPTSTHPLQRTKQKYSPYSVPHTSLRPPQVSKHRRRQVTPMAHRAFLLLLVIFLFQPPACEATPPVFDVDVLLKTLYIPADTSTGTAIYLVRARDNQVNPDLPMSFELSGSGSSYFRINVVGDIDAHLTLHSSLTRGETYSLTITATDTAGEVTSTTTQITATDAPATPANVFIKYPTDPIRVKEDVRKQTVVASLQARKNSNQNQYPEIKLTGSNKFGIKTVLVNRDVTRIDVVVKEDLDFEEQSSYLLNVSAVRGYRDPNKDNRNIVIVPLTIIVEDVQDTAPIFEKLPPITRIPADAKVEDPVVKIQAKDGDKNTPANINYRIEGQYLKYFKVSPTGQVTVAAPLNDLLKDCQDTPIVLDVKAEESASGLRPFTKTEVILLITNPTVSTVNFASSTFRATIDENAPVNTPVVFQTPAEVLSKADCGIIQLEIRSPSGQRRAQDIFEIKPSILYKTKIFQIVVKSPTQLDYEQVKEIQFEVVARNVRIPNTEEVKASVIVALNDLNDNIPAFVEERYHVRIAENAEEQILVQVSATDQDGGDFGTVRYKNVRGKGPMEGKVEVDEKTGQVRLVTAHHGLDRETQVRHILTVEAEDNKGIGGNVKTAEIEITLTDVNDKAPMFSRRDYYFCLPSTLRRRETFWTASAVDLDGPGLNSMIQYSIVGNNELFKMSSDGRLYMDQDPSLISDSRPDMEFIIRAKDMGQIQLQGEATVHISWDKRTCKTLTMEYLVEQQPSNVQANRANMERLLTDLNGGALTKINSIEGIQSGTKVRSAERQSDGRTPMNKANTKIMATVIRHDNNAVTDLTVFNQPSLGNNTSMDNSTNNTIPGVEAVEQYTGGGVSDAWKWVLIALLILLAIVLFLLLACCLCKPTKKKTSHSSSQRSQVVEVATIGANRHRHHHHHRQPPPGDRGTSAPTDRRAANGRGGAAYSRHMQEEAPRPRKSLDGADGEEVMIDPATGKRYRVRYENGRRILVRSGEGEKPGKKVTRGTNVTENSLEAVETSNTPPMTVVEGDDDQKQLLKNQFLEKKSLFTIAYDGMHSKHDLLKDSDDTPTIT